ncbi:MAG TPA: hypothetical protein VMI54_23025 [Polyangiaceae bacterium]|nr:hypothetical protein [Polyangiaceae bacterium]
MTRVNCEDVRDALRGGRPASDPELAAHAAGCAQCAALLADEAALGRSLATAGSDGEFDAALWGELERDLGAETGARAWLRSRPTPLRAGLAVGGVFAVTALGLRHLRPNWDGLSKAVLGAWLFAFTGVAALAVRVALPVLDASSARRRAALLAAFGLPVVYAALGELSFDATFVAAPFFASALSCFLYGTLLSTPLVALLWLLDRGSGSRSRLIAGAAACGLAANAALLLHCPATDPAHLLVGHGAIGFTLALVAWLFAR